MRSGLQWHRMFRRNVASEIEIDASPERVWSILTDLPHHPDWDPFIRQIEGALVEGSSLKVRIKPPGGREVTFRPKVLRAEPGRQLRWLGRLGLPFLLDGEHSWTIEPLGESRIRFVQQEEFRGLLVPFVRSTLSNTERGFNGMNLALKQRAEG
jgi:hypothetical protein